MDYYKNIRDLKKKREMVKKLEVNKFPVQILNKSIVFEFYLKGHRTFSSLNTKVDLI